MKKILSIALIAGASALSFAQVSFAGKANLLFPTQSGSWQNIRNTALEARNTNATTSTGFNVGVSAKIDLPITSLFVMPELYYTHFNNKYTDPVTNTTLEARSNRIDVPVLLGYNIWGKTLGAFVGPVASYNLSNNNTFNDFTENAKNSFTVGFQFGAQAQFKNIIVNARYEGAFSKDQRTFTNRAMSIAGANYDVRYDDRPSMLILGLGYAF